MNKVIKRVRLNNIPFDHYEYGHATGDLLVLDDGNEVYEYEGTEDWYEDADDCVCMDEDEYYGDYEEDDLYDEFEEEVDEEEKFDHYEFTYDTMNMPAEANNYACGFVHAYPMNKKGNQIREKSVVALVRISKDGEISVVWHYELLKDYGASEVVEKVKEELVSIWKKR